MRKPVFRVSNKVSFKPVSSATETSYKMEISPVASLHIKLSEKANNKCADQTARMRRLVCACVVCKLPKTGFLVSRSIMIKLFFLLKHAPIILPTRDQYQYDAAIVKKGERKSTNYFVSFVILFSIFCSKKYIMAILK